MLQLEGGRKKLLLEESRYSVLYGLLPEDVKVTWMVFEQRGSEIENGKDVD